MAATLYTGNGTAQTVNNAVNGISFTPDMVWNKGRSVAYNHNLVDVIRGNSNVIFSNTTDAEQNPGAQLDITTNGFISTYRSANLANNQSAATYVGWQWNAGGTTVTNGTGTISSQVRANTTAGFSVVTYTGTGANATVGHGLGVVPGMIIVKNRLQAYNWTVYHIGLGGATNILNLNSTSASIASAVQFNGTNPTLSVFSVGAGGVANNNTNTTSDTFVAYCWAPVAGYSAFGSYTGNSSADGPFIYTGFRPRWLMIKNITVAGQWMIWDSSRDTYNPEAARLDAQDSAAELSVSVGDFVSNGIKLRVTGTSYNATGSTYIYAAFAENPLKYANAR